MLCTDLLICTVPCQTWLTAFQFVRSWMLSDLEHYGKVTFKRKFKKYTLL